MLYRRVFTMRGLHVRESEWNRFDLLGGRAELVLEPGEAQPGSAVVPDARVRVTLRTRDPKPAQAEIFAQIRELRGPGTIAESTELLVAQRSDVDWRGRDVVTDEMMPAAFQAYMRQISDTIERTALDFTALFRWRLALSGPVSPIAHRDRLYWSDDKGATWRLMPLTIRANATISVTVNIAQEVHDDLTVRFERGEREPVGRELFREALEQIEDNPRSALALAVAALEIGVKRTISELQPATAWLLEQPGAPAAEAMLRDLLPAAPLRLRFVGGDVVPPPLLESVRKAVFARNALVHAGAPAPERDSLIALVTAIRDVLLLLDYVRGFSWAFGQLTEQTKALLTPDG